MWKSDFHPVVAQWIGTAFEAPTACQRQAWPAIQSGRHTLVAAPTGSGKTLAAFLTAIDDLIRLSVASELPDATTVVYVSPLKALSNDIERNLNVPLQSIHRALEANATPYTPIRVAVRTGDTPQSARAAMKRRPPHILVTTPESLYILLTSESGRQMLGDVRTVIVDEIHALAGNKRGAHLSLSLERLSQLTLRPPLRIGLSATQRPIDEVARFLVGMEAIAPDGDVDCEIIDEGHVRDRDLAIELPQAPLEAVLSGDAASENYDRIAELIREHKTTLVFVNTRRLAERVARALSDRIGEEFVTSHHGSMAKERRHDAEQRLKSGQLKALVATASLELGIDIGDVELVCQVGSTRTLATFLQRVGRSGHSVGAMAKGRIFPQTRDQLMESAALLDMTRRGELDSVEVRDCPLDVLAQQIVAEVSGCEWSTEALFELCRKAYCFRSLKREKFDQIIKMLADGYSFARGRTGAYVHWDAINGMVRGRRGARLTALTCGGAIPDNADYDVIMEPSGAFVGSVNEDFAIESLPGNVFQLGNTSWRVLRVDSSAVRVADAAGEPPNMPFWLGEAPARSAELSFAVSRLRENFSERVGADFSVERDTVVRWLSAEIGVGDEAASQMYDYLLSGNRALGIMPTQQNLVIERFFDESGGMQLVLHSPFGSAVNRAWGLALRKRFCRTFNFELQAAAIEDAIVISLGSVHSFELSEVWRYLAPETVRDVLTQAVLDVPMFNIRWRWVANCALALPRFRGGKKVPPRLQRMNAEDLAALLFPDQLACAENLNGAREIPDHPLIEQALQDCLTEAMDIGTLESLLTDVVAGKKRLVSLDVTEPSPFAQEILNANPYAFLDDAPLEERRTQAVQSRRWLDPETASDLGALDESAIARVADELIPFVTSADELHETLLLMGCLTTGEASTLGGRAWESWFEQLQSEKRVLLVEGGSSPSLWVASERYGELRQLWRSRTANPNFRGGALEMFPALDADEALVSLVRARVDNSTPQTSQHLADLLGMPERDISIALASLEARGIVFRGRYLPSEDREQWCDRRVLARIHRYTVKRLRSEIEPVPATTYLRFLFDWQGLSTNARRQGAYSTVAVVEQLSGFEAAAQAWESEIIPARVSDYRRDYLDQNHLNGKLVWLRLTGKRSTANSSNGPFKSTPMSLLPRTDLKYWLAVQPADNSAQLSGAAKRVLGVLEQRGAAFFDDIIDRCGILKSQGEQALGELAAGGYVTSDSYEGLRVLLIAPSRRRPLNGSRRRNVSISSIDSAGRWDLIARQASGDRSDPLGPDSEELDCIVRTLLRRYGIVFKIALERESALPQWRYILWSLRRLEARGEIRGGRFIAGFSGEQFALPDALEALRRKNKRVAEKELVAVSACDPLNLVGIVTPGLRITATLRNRIIYLDGEPLAVRLGTEINMLKACDQDIEMRARTLLIEQASRARTQLRALR